MMLRTHNQTVVRTCPGRRTPLPHPLIRMPHMSKVVHEYMEGRFDSKKPPPRGAFPVYYVPLSRTVRGAQQAEDPPRGT